jgi:uncharacterized protein (DUF362 family)
VTRRKFIPLAGAAVLGTYAGLKLQRPPKLPDGPPGNSAVSVQRARSYSDDLVSRMIEGIRQCGLDPRGKRVLLKPNLVEFDSATVINTDASVIAAAVEVFQKLGASEVRIGEGPGHRRDTLDLADDARYRSTIPKFESIFTDLNRDDVSAVRGFAGEPEFYFANTVLAADLIVSLAKMKTHHWAGATLSMKNFFGLVPGSVYGWPKNKLHYIGIPESVVALNRKFRNTFAIVDGIVGMEGNGPIQGTPKPVGVLVMGSDLVAVDATCCRIMGIDPEKVEYLRLAADLGHLHRERIEQRGETVASVRSNFALIDEYKDLRLA